MFSELMTGLGERLRQRLSDTRVSLRHPGDKGTHAEQALRDVLAQYLPRRLSVGQGEVIDTHGARSGQVDIVIANEEQPLIYPQGEPGLFFIEGVDAAGEVKSVLTSAELARAIENSIKFKSLAAQPSIGLRVAPPSDVERFHERRPYFIFAYESQVTLELACERVQEAERASNGQVVDAIFALDRGTILNLADGRGSLGIARPDGTRHTGWIIKPGEDAMFGLFAWLSMVMPRMQRLTPILPDYMIATSEQSAP